MSIESLGQYFGAIEDPRCSGKVEHRLPACYMDLERGRSIPGPVWGQAVRT